MDDVPACWACPRQQTISAVVQRGPEKSGFAPGALANSTGVDGLVAQLVLERISMMPCQEVEDLDATERGAGGFGSTGVSASPKRQRVVAPGGPSE